MKMHLSSIKYNSYYFNVCPLNKKKYLLSQAFFTKILHQRSERHLRTIV